MVLALGLCMVYGVDHCIIDVAGRQIGDRKLSIFYDEWLMHYVTIIYFGGALRYIDYQCELAGYFNGDGFYDPGMGICGLCFRITGLDLR